LVIQQTVPRGLLLHSESNEFRVSNDETDNLFDSINEEASVNFQTRSAPRLFAPVIENEFAIDFVVPGTVDSAASVQGYGGVFVDVVEEATTKVTFYAKSGCVIAEEYVKPAPGGLSFLGVKAGEGSPAVFQVKVKLGNQALDNTDGGAPCQGFFSCGFQFIGSLFGLGSNNNQDVDIVVMDDFLYSEPQAV